MCYVGPINTYARGCRNGGDSFVFPSYQTKKFALPESFIPCIFVSVIKENNFIIILFLETIFFLHTTHLPLLPTMSPLPRANVGGEVSPSIQFAVFAKEFYFLHCGINCWH